MFNLIFTQAARSELIEAQDWYEGEAPGLGRRFREAIDAWAERMSANPRQFPVVFKRSTRYKCAIFGTFRQAINPGAAHHFAWPDP